MKKFKVFTCLLITAALLLLSASCGYISGAIDLDNMLGNVYESEDGVSYSFEEYDDPEFGVTSRVAMCTTPDVEYKTIYLMGIFKKDGKKVVEVNLRGYLYDGDDEKIAAQVEDLNREIDAHRDEHNGRLPYETYSFVYHDDYIRIDGVRYDKK